jgi:hypothetical protein
MEQGKDVNNIIDGTWTWMQYASTIGQIPELHKYLLGNVALSEFSDRISDANPIPLIIKVITSSPPPDDESISANMDRWHMTRLKSTIRRSQQGGVEIYSSICA